MATITNITPAHAGNLQGATAFGNLAVLRYVLQTDSTGALVGGDSNTPLKSGDVVRLGVLPAGFRIFDSMSIVNNNMTGGSAKVGFAYIDGIDDLRVPQNNGVFGNPIASNSHGKYRVGGSIASFALPKSAHIIFTVGEDNAKESLIEIFLYAIVEGAA